jgi:hypothetical protein
MEDRSKVMTRKMLTLVAGGLVAMVVTSEAKAQNMPFCDFNAWMAQNAAFDQMMDQRARQFAWDYARSLPPGYVVPVNPNFAAGYREASERYIRGMQANSQRTSAAINRWDNGAIRGQWGYAAPNGQVHMLPSNHGGYTVTPYGHVQPGWTGNGTYLYPVNNWGY